MQKFKLRRVYSFTYRGIDVEIVNWSFDSSFDKLDKWNYYLYLRPDYFADKSIGDSIWLETKLERFTPSSPEREIHDYYGSSVLRNLEMHGGITFYEKVCAHPRIVKVGCDFMHIYDDQIDWDEQLLAEDAKQTIDKFLADYKYAPPTKSS